VKLEQTARDNEAEAQARVLPTEELNTLADAFGLEAADDRKGFAEKLKTEEGDSSANQKMLATVLKRLDKNKNVDGANAIEKLDSLTDKYAEAKGDPEKLKQLAKSYNMSVGDLNKMMQQTEFLGMREETGTYTQEKLAKEMSAVAGRDIAAETASESASTQHISGEIRVTGDVVNGTGTLQGVTTSLGS